MQNPPQGHYLPAVNAHLGTSFVTPNVNDPSFFFVPNPAMNIIPHTMQARIGSRRNPAYPSRPSSSYSYGEQVRVGFDFRYLDTRMLCNACIFLFAQFCVNNS